MSSDDRVLVNLGAGLQHEPGWISYDRSRVVYVARFPALRRLMGIAHRIGLLSQREPLSWSHDVRVRDITRGLPHRDGSVDVVYSSHVLEHLSPEDARFVLRESCRILRSGGLVRVVVPDLRRAVDAYVARDHAFFGSEAGVIADAFVASLHMRSLSRGRAIERFARRILRNDDGGHRWMYDGESMAARLTEAGFVDVRTVGYREGSDASVASLDKRPRDSVHLEALKP